MFYHHSCIKPTDRTLQPYQKFSSNQCCTLIDALMNAMKNCANCLGVSGSAMYATRSLPNQSFSSRRPFQPARRGAFVASNANLIFHAAHEYYQDYKLGMCFQDYAELFGELNEQLWDTPTPYTVYCTSGFVKLVFNQTVCACVFML